LSSASRIRGITAAPFAVDPGAKLASYAIFAFTPLPFPSFGAFIGLKSYYGILILDPEIVRQHPEGQGYGTLATNSKWTITMT
jgi:hypothetical protein